MSLFVLDSDILDLYQTGHPWRGQKAGNCGV